MTISGRKNIHNLIINELAKAADSGGLVRLIMNPDNELFNLVSTIFWNVDSLKIEHIITLSNNRGIMDNSEDYNLYCMTKVLTLYTERINYNAYYCYKYGRGNDIGLSVFPYMVLLSDSMILISGDCESALCFNDKGTNRLGNEIWNRMFSDVSIIVDKKNDIISYFDLLDVQSQSETTVCYVYQLFPNAILWMNDEIFQKYVKKILDRKNKSKSELISVEDIRSKILRQKKMFSQIETYAFCSFDEIRYFLDTGLIDELSSYYYDKISKKDRVEIVKNICNHPLNYHLRLLKNEPHVHHGYPSLFITDRRGYITINKNDGEPIYFTFTEPSNLLAFKDFFTNADDSFCYKEEISNQKIKELIHEYETELKNI